MIESTPAGWQIAYPGPLPARIVPRGPARALAWTDLGRDLVELAMAILLADRRVPRSKAGRRRLNIALPVRSPQTWDQQRERLREILSFLTEDHFSFGFRQASPDQATLDGDLGREAPALGGRVALFSGGLDSACAAALFARQRIPTTFVTQYTTGIGRIERLLDDIRTACEAPADRFRLAGFHISPTSPFTGELRENSRRSRSFLFVSLALAVAAGTGAGEVCVCENGPLALNLPLTPAMMPTRHAHGQFLAAMERLGSNLFQRPIRVVNPFELATKGEMVRQFAAQPRLALATTSCWYQQWSGRGGRHGKGHCGVCVPCLVRRVALESAGIPVPRDHFDLDVRRPGRDVDPRKLGPYRNLLDFAARVEACSSWRVFLRRFPAAVEAQPTCHALEGDAWFRALFAMMKRFAQEVRITLGRSGT